MMYILYELWDVWVDSTSGDQKWPNVREAQDGCWKFHVVWYEESQGARVWCLRMDSTLFTQASVSSWQFRSLRTESWKQILRSFETRIAWTRHTPANTRTGAKKLFTKWYQENTPVPCIQSSKYSFESLNSLEYSQRHACHDLWRMSCKIVCQDRAFAASTLTGPGLCTVKYHLHQDQSMEELETADVRPTRQQFPYAGAFRNSPEKNMSPKWSRSQQRRLMSGTFGLEIWLRHISKANEAETTFRLWGFHAHPDFGDRYDVRWTVRESEIWRSHDSHLFENLGHRSPVLEGLISQRVQGALRAHAALPQWRYWTYMHQWGNV